MQFANIISESINCFLILLKILHSSRSQRFSSMLFSKSLIVFHFIFKSAIHFKLTFILGIRFRSIFLFWLTNVQLLQYHGIKACMFLHWITFAPSSKISWAYLFEFIFVMYPIQMIFVFPSTNTSYSTVSISHRQRIEVSHYSLVRLES